MLERHAKLTKEMDRVKMRVMIQCFFMKMNTNFSCVIGTVAKASCQRSVSVSARSNFYLSWYMYLEALISQPILFLVLAQI